MPCGVQESRTPPYWLTWLRFSAFLVLYPMGVASEMALVRLAYPAISEQRIFCFDMPNRLNFGLDYPVCCLLLTALYLPGELPYLQTVLLPPPPPSPPKHTHTHPHTHTPSPTRFLYLPVAGVDLPQHAC